MIKALIFDWAGVLGKDGYWIWLKKNIDDFESRRPFFQEISDYVDSGRIPHGEFLKKLSSASGKSENQIWREVKSEIIINEELVSLVRKIKSKYKIGLLSNFTYPWLQEVITENNLWELFDNHIISSEHKMIKPNPEMFQKMLGMLDVKPNEAVFVDDRQVHVDAAKRSGLESVLFVNNEKLVEDLRKLGIEV